ncbi:hypothetical protein MJO29_015205 [Puccinia striiformis f. sp. tritici]|nr:hypothetical protein MJO29_015205 [Puccinia striiformis f. sp. tritici]
MLYSQLQPPNMMSTSTIYVKHTSRIHASRPASFGPHFNNPEGQPMNLIPIEAYLNSEKEEPSHRKGCPTTTTTSTEIPTHDWIALIERGHCAFVEKVRYAQKLGASAVIVGDHHNSIATELTPFLFSKPTISNHNNFGFNSGLLTMYAPGDTSDLSIPSVFVARDSYLSLRQDWLDFSAIPEHQSTDQIHSLQVIMSKDELWTWPFFDLVIILLFLPSILTIVTLLLHRISTFRKRRADRAPRELVNRLPSVIWAKDMEKGIPLLSDPNYLPTQDSQPSSVPATGWIPALRQWLQNIQPRFHPTISFANPRSEQTPLLTPSITNQQQLKEPVLRKQQKKVYFSQRECAICLSDFEVGDLIRILPCGHCFHQSQLEEQCMGIDCWLLKSKRFCPICRMSIVEEPENPSETNTVTPIINTNDPIEDLVGASPEPIPLPSHQSSLAVHNHHSSTGTHHAPIPSSSSVTLDHPCTRSRNLN